jgi:outer membrane protein TolC
MPSPTRTLLLALGPVAALAAPAAAQPPAPGAAQSPAAAAQPPAATEAAPAPLLTFDAALDAARKNNRDLAVARARLEQAAAGVRQAWAGLFPVAAAQGKYTHNNREVAITVPGGPMDMMGPPRTIVIQRQEQLDGVLNVQVPLLVPWAYPALRAARLSEGAAEANREASEATVLLATAQTYWALVGSDEVLRARGSAVEVAERTVANANARLAAGTATKVDLARAQLALLRAQQATREADLARAQTARALATLTQIRTAFRVEAPPAGPAAPAEEGIYERALELRPELRALSLGAQSAAAQARSAAWRWAPSVSGFGNGRIFNYAGFSGDRYAWAVGLQLDWTLFDGGIRDAQRRLANAQRRETEARALQLQDAIGDDLKNARGQLDVRRSAEQTATQSVALARQTLELVRAQYEAGAVTQLDLLSAQDALVGAEVGLAQARVDAAVADLSLRRTAGVFPGGAGR